MNRLLRLNNVKWVCHHLHIDKSKTITTKNLYEASNHMKNKWITMRDIKKTYSLEDLQKRMRETTKFLVKQNCSKMRTFIDVDTLVGLKPLYAALKVKHEWKKYNIDLQIGTQPLEGLTSRKSVILFNEASKHVDFIGCLPSRDKDPKQHLEVAFDKAAELNLPIEAHLDQCNIPSEKETELFCDFVDKYNYRGKSRAIHCISLACHSEEYQRHIARRLAELNIGVIICPSAAISMTQHSEYTAPIHNSIGPVQIFIEEGVDVGLGVDNIEDIFVPFCDGNLEFELRMLAEATRIYDPNILLKIATNDMGFN